MADISSTLSFQDHMSAAMKVISNRMDEAAASAKIAKYDLEDLQNTEKAAKAHLDALTSATIKDNQAIKEAQKAWRDATKAVDAQTLKVSKYETALLQNEIRLNKMKEQEQQVKTAIDQTTQATQKGTIGFESMQGKIVTLSAAFQLFNQAMGIIRGVNAKINEFVQYSKIQAQAEDQLSIITKQRMALNDDEVRSLYDLASAQQKLGVIGDEAVIKGMAGIASFTTQKRAIEALTPAMNNLAVKTQGYNVTAESMDGISRALGRAMQGDVGQLSRMGVKIDDVTKKRLMHLKEEERAIELARIIKSVTGDMNEEMAKTPYGQMQQAQNALGDSFERLGNILLPIQSAFVVGWSKIVQATVSALEKIVSISASLIDPFVKIFLTAFAGIATYATVYYGILVAKTIWAAGVTAAQWTAAWIKTIIATREVIAANILASTQTAIAWLKNIPIYMQNIVSLGIMQAQALLAGDISFKAGLKAAAGWLIANAPLLATIAVVGALIFAFVKLNKSVEQVLNFVIDKFINMGQVVLGVLQSIAQGIDNVFHTDLASGVASLSEKLEKGREKAHSATAKLQGGIDKTVGNIRNILGPRDILGGGNGKNAGLDGLTTNTSGGKALKTQNQGKVEFAQDNLELLHDITTQKYAQYFQQLTPNLNISNMNISNEVDVDMALEAFANAITGSIQTKLA